MSSPFGLIIGGNKASNQWRIGKEIGTGACASVHLVIGPDGKASDYVAKVTPIPTKTTKQKKSAPERNARLLHHEALLYQTTFPEYQGDILPALPRNSGPPITGDPEDKFRFLAMEKMEAPLVDVVPLLLRASTNSINLGPVAQRLLECVEGFHKKDHILVDIKEANFMLAKCSKLKRQRKMPTAEEELASRIRVLDIALATRLKGPDGKHRPDEGAEIQGTPLYLSRHVHEKHTPSRRDDIEAILILVSELIIRIVAETNGLSGKYMGSSRKEVESFLPWSSGKSDCEIGAIKTEQLENGRSEFYSRMGDIEIAELMHSLFNITSCMEYKSKPDYAIFREELGRLQLPWPRKKAATKAGRSSRGTRSKRVAEPADIEDLSDSPSPKKQSRAAKEIFAEMETEDEFHDAVEEMDIDENTKENQDKTDAKSGFTITIISGPDSGIQFDLIVGGPETVTIGKAPKLQNGKLSEGLWPLEDPDADDAHAKLELKASKKLCSVTVKDLKSTSGVIVGSKKLTRGREAQCFLNDTFQVGNNIFDIKPLQQFLVEEAASKTARNSKVAAKEKEPLSEADVSADSNTAADITLKVQTGPHEGQSFALVLNQAEIINIGSAKSSTKGESIVLSSDSCLEGLHARFELKASKKLLTVAVTDLSTRGALEINGKKIGKKKAHIAFMNDRVKLTKNTTIEILRG